VVPTPVNVAGRPISVIAATQATTIHSVLSMVREARLGTRPCQASQIAPRMTTGTRYGKKMALPSALISLSTAFCSQVKMFPAADWYTVIVTRSTDLAASKTIPATLLPISDVLSEHCRPCAAQNWPATP